MLRFLVLTLGLCVACSTSTTGSSGGGSSSSSSGSADAGPTPIAAADYCEATASVFCPFYLRCGRMAVTTEAECLTAFVEACNARYEPRYLALVNVGMLTLSADGVEACRAHLQAVACEAQPRDLDGPCGAMWVGTRPVTSDCGLDVESLVCGAGTSCVLGLDFCGSCEPLLPSGAACGNGEGTCGNQAACVNNVCEPRAQAGASCANGERCVSGTACDGTRCLGPNYVGLGDACDQANRCPYMAQCVGGVCVAQVLQGNGCNPSTPCASGWCNSSVCAAPKPDGQPCTAADQCQSGVCSMGSCASLPGRCFSP